MQTPSTPQSLYSLASFSAKAPSFRITRCACRTAQRFLLEKCDHVGSILRAIEGKEHFRPGNNSLRVGEPFIERGFVPDDVRGFQSRRVIVIRKTAGFATDNVPVSRSNSVLIERVADHTLAIDRRSVLRVSGCKTRTRTNGRQDQSERCRWGHSTVSTNAPANAVVAVVSNVQDVPPCNGTNERGSPIGKTNPRYRTDYDQGGIDLFPAPHSTPIDDGSPETTRR